VTHDPRTARELLPDARAEVGRIFSQELVQAIARSNAPAEFGLADLAACCGHPVQAQAKRQQEPAGCGKVCALDVVAIAALVQIFAEPRKSIPL